MKNFIFTLLFAVCFSSYSDNLTTTDGKVYEEIQLQNISFNKITVMHKKGISSIPYEKLNKESQDKYGLNSPENINERKKAAELPITNYSYNGKPIPENKFNKLYNKFGKNIFYYKGDFFDLANDDGELKGYKDGCGIINIKLTSINKSSKEANCETSSDDHYYIINLNNEDFAENLNIPVLKVDKVKEGYVNKILSFETLIARLNPTTKEQFAEYLAKGNVFYTNSAYKTDSRCEQKTCGQCSGSGKITNSSYNRNRLGSEPLVRCSTCNGTGIITKFNTVYKQPEKLVYQP